MIFKVHAQDVAYVQAIKVDVFDCPPDNVALYWLVDCFNLQRCFLTGFGMF